ncbi:MAG TPA: hypothetical protein VGF23_03350, partial [Gaiellaceae bacterium]
MRKVDCGNERRGGGAFGAARRAAVFVSAVAVALGTLAGQARADDVQPIASAPAATLPVAPVSVGDAAPAAEAPAAQAAVDSALAATAGVVQAAASNTNISVRVLSPGDNGA